MRTLNHFLILADTLHFGRAAQACHMSPSTLSRAIRQLESAVGARLFERDNRSVTLTDAGHLFRRYAREATMLWTDFREELLDKREQLTGTLLLYSSVTASYSFLFDLLTQLRAQHPGIDITLQTGDPEQAMARVQSGDAQLSIGARPARLHDSVSFQSIATTPLVFIAAKNNARRTTLTGQKTSPSDWQNIPIILPERGVARDHTLAWFRQRHITPRIASQVAGNEAIVSMVSLGDSIGLVPQIVLDNSPLADTVQILPVSTAPRPLEVGLFVLKRSLKNRLVEALWAAAKPTDA